MKRDLVEHLCCPACRADLTLSVEAEQAGGVESGSLGCDSCRRSYPIVRGVPRFVESDGYVKSFSYEWNRWNDVQLDVVNGRAESEETFIEKTGLRPEDVRGKLVLDVGCGAGRFADVVNRWGGRVVGIDYSFAVEAAQHTLGRQRHVDVVQADVFALPFKDDVFDVIFSIGVLHHTKDTRQAFLQLPRHLKDGGAIAVCSVTVLLHRSALQPRVGLLAFHVCWIPSIGTRRGFKTKAVRQHGSFAGSPRPDFAASSCWTSRPPSAAAETTRTHCRYCDRCCQRQTRPDSWSSVRAPRGWRPFSVLSLSTLRIVSSPSATTRLPSGGRHLRAIPFNGSTSSTETTTTS